MPATKKEKSDRKQGKARRTKDRRPAADPREPSAASAATAAADDGRSGTRETRPARPARADARPMKVKAREAARRIRGLADLSESLDARRRLRQLASQISSGSRDVQGISFIEGLIGECLDESSSCSAQRERWLACEAATWALAWLARTRRAGGSAGGLLERLVKEARSAVATLEARDTSPSRFVVALARLFRDIEACRCVERHATAALDEEIGRLVSADGVVAVAGAAAVIDRVCLWTAVREIAETTGKTLPWSEATDGRWAAAARMALRLLGAHGRILIGAGRLPAAFSEPLLAVAERSKDAAVRRTAATFRTPQKALERSRSKRLLPRDLHAPDAAVAVIRTGWQRDSLRVLLEYRQPTPRIEIAAGDRLLVDGPWQWRVAVGGRPLEAEGPWTVSGFESDRKATFLEIVAPLAGGLQIERQVVVLPRDRIVLLADAVTHSTALNGAADRIPPAGTISYESIVPPAMSLETERAEETREVFVYDTSMRMMALPLALPEWASGPTAGGFEPTTNGLALKQETAGGRLYAPLWLDCNPSRFGRPLTWRQLTVADTRQNLPRHQAAGFRVQAGLEQWLLYRALDMPRNRTVLGCNLSCEFLLGRIGRRGVVSRTLEIQ
jgi:hypothetical protein